MLFVLLAIGLQPVDTERFAKWEKEIAAIETRLKEKPPKPGGVLFSGSSSIRLWDLKKSFPEKEYVNVGFGGSEIRDSTHFVSRIVAPHKPQAIVFYAGDNDIASGRKPEQLLSDFKEFCTAVHKDAPKCRVLFIPVKPSLARWAKFDEQKKANALVKEFCGADERFAYVDIVPAMLGPDGKPIPDLFVKDGLHLSPAGYEKWTASVKAALEKLHRPAPQPPLPRLRRDAVEALRQGATAAREAAVVRLPRAVRHNTLLKTTSPSPSA